MFKLSFYDICGCIPKNSWLNSNIAYIPCKKSSRKLHQTYAPKLIRSINRNIWDISLSILDREFVERIESHTFNEINIRQFKKTRS